jgi:hypothetical protein
MDGVIELNPGQVKIFGFLSCSCYAVILHYKKNYYSKVFYYYFFISFNKKSITVHHCMALLQVALVSIPPHKFVHPPSCYYQL